MEIKNSKPLDSPYTRFDYSSNAPYKLFAKAGYITKDSRKKIINLAVAMRQREWIEGLWNKSKSFDLPVKSTPVFSP